MFASKIRIGLLLWAILLVQLSAALLANEPLGTPSLDDLDDLDLELASTAEIELGKKLFFDKRLSFNNSQSCATCHNPELGFGDGLRFSLGANGNSLKRHTPHLYNLGWNVAFLWDGRSPSLEHQALMPIQDMAEMAMPLDDLEARLNKIKGYKQLFNSVYGTEQITQAHIAKALSAFEMTIISNNSAFDRYIAGDKKAMTESAIRGLQLFKGKARCIECHDGPNFTNNAFHNLGIETSDKGRGGVFNDPSLYGAFKTPGLRNTLLTAPYMHDGSLGSLQEVIEFYNVGGGPAKNKDKLMTPLKLTAQEIADLVAFLGSLTDPVVVQQPELPK